jgi:hypothetical protein
MPDVPKNFRISETLWADVEQLATELQDHPDLAPYGRVTPSLVVRLLLQAGIPVLRSHYGIGTNATQAPRKPAPMTPDERQERTRKAAAVLGPKAPARPARPKVDPKRRRK